MFTLILIKAWNQLPVIIYYICYISGRMAHLRLIWSLMKPRKKRWYTAKTPPLPATQLLFTYWFVAAMSTETFYKTYASYCPQNKACVCVFPNQDSHPISTSNPLQRTPYLVRSHSLEHTFLVSPTCCVSSADSASPPPGCPCRSQLIHSPSSQHLAFLSLWGTAYSRDD